MDKLYFVVSELYTGIQLHVYDGTTKRRFQTISLIVRPLGWLAAMFIGSQPVKYIMLQLPSILSSKVTHWCKLGV